MPVTEKQKQIEVISQTIIDTLLLQRRERLKKKAESKAPTTTCCTLAEEDRDIHAANEGYAREIWQIYVDAGLDLQATAAYGAMHYFRGRKEECQDLLDFACPE